MDTTAGTPVEPAPIPEALRVGDHVHQLLNLVHAMAAHGAGISSDTPESGFAFGVDVGAMSDRESRQWSQDVEELLRYGHALAVQSAGDQDQRAGAGRYAETGATNSVGLLVQSLHLSAAEASRRIHLAKQVLPIVDTITGAIAPTSHPALSHALFNGTLSQERALTVSHYLEEATRLAGNGRITEEENTEVEEFLVNAAASQGPDSIRHLGNRIMANLDPDGNKPSTADLKAKQGLFFRQARRGLVSIHGACTIEQYEQLIAWIGFTTNPNKHTNIDTLNNDTNDTNDTNDGPDRGADATPNTDDDNDCKQTGDGSAENVMGGTSSSVGTGPQCDGQTSLIDLLHDATTFFSTRTGSSGIGDSDTGGPGGSDSNENAPAPDSDPSSRSESESQSDFESDRPRNPQVPSQLQSQAPSEPEDLGTAQPGPYPTKPPTCQPETAPPPPKIDQEPPESPEPAAQPQAPAPAPVPGPARSVPESIGNGWRRRLEPWEVPPRPPEAPENAIPPCYPGDPWFWFTTKPTTTGWNPIPATDDFAACEPDPQTELGGEPDTSTPEPKTDTPEPEPDPATSPDPDPDPDPEDGFRSGWDSRGLDDPDMDDTGEDGAEPWPHLVNGITVPAPGSGVLPTLMAHTDGSNRNVEFDLFDSIDPASTNPAVKDTRTHGQKLLDGLISCVKLAARTGQLPLNGGLKTQLIISCSEEDLHRTDGTGTAFTTRSGPVPLHLFDQSLCDPETTRFVYGHGQTIINAGRTQRLFTPAQRKLLYARDLGCSFPDCRAAATWCEAHHIIPWQEGGDTNLNNAALVCEHHHTLLHHSGWELTLINGTPWYTPPWTIDPTQTKIRNHFHHGLARKP